MLTEVDVTGITVGIALNDLGCTIGGMIVYHDNFIEAGGVGLGKNCVQAGANALLFIAGRNDDGDPGLRFEV